ncbi:MAG: type II CRISPR RNA-guided endonuclease Cas9 [Candidatus Coproplasma sp.]
MEKFYLGMDIGTNSVGMACTDENYKLLRTKGKDCWAVRLFDESQTAVERRTFRVARRRLERRKQRIGFLQAVFSSVIPDKLFFIRLNNSQFLAEDKDERLNADLNNLFADKDFKDKQYHEQYPTIYHLRKALMSQPISDLRLYYLTLHHIVKYRGHFLFEGSMADIRDFSRLISDLNQTCSEIYEQDVPTFDISLCEQAKEILICSGKDKPKRIEQLFNLSDKRAKEIIKGICGYSVKPSALLGEKYKEEKSFDMKKTTDETFEAMRSTYGDDFALLEAIRAIYNYITFEKLLEGQPDVSSAMVALYDKHKSDLQLLKDFIHNNATQSDYNRLFKSVSEGANYVNYVGYTKKGGDKLKVKKCKDEEFYAYLKKFISSLLDVKDNDTQRKILEGIEEGSFLPKILHADNGLFPHQVNEDELNKIVENMVKNCPQTEQIAEMILPVFLYRIPYYVGPLTGVNGWAKRKVEGVKITPWNFNEVIDFASSNEAFMRRMTSKCSYLHGEDVLPKASVYYQIFNVLNQINKLKFNDCAISVEIKQEIFNKLFLTKKRVTDNDIKNLLVRNGLISESEKKSTTITGKDGELNASMSSYIQLKQILGKFVDEDIASEGGVCENIILWHTLNTDKRVVEELIRKNYGDIPEISANIKALKGLVFKDFGRLSKRFLTQIKAVDKTSGELCSIIGLLYNTNQNLNEILYDERYNFQSVINEENGEQSREVTYEDIEELYVSPAVRRGIWQSLKMAEEYVCAIGREPNKIFIEVTREEGKKGNDGRTVSRQKKLLEKYKAIDGIEDLSAELNKKTDMQLRQERLYLYFRQLGRCMYSGERIDLELLNTNQYDVDHILPRSYLKDDSLDNKVLVLRSKNSAKSDIYPIPHGLVSDEAKKHWKVLLEKGLISDTTYKRLTRTQPLTEDDYKDFINRQKTITDQTVKAVAQLLGRKYPQTKIVYSKAKNVSDFRQRFDLFKCRETNDLHHARDAYLNVVVGNVYDTCFSTSMAMFRQDGDKWRNYNLKTMFHRNVKGAWVQDDNATISLVKAIYAKSSMAVTRYAYCNKGAFYDQTVYGKDDNSITAPRKANGVLCDTSKYGGYKSQKTAYFAIVQSVGKRGKPIKTIEAVPVLVAYQSRNNPSRLQEYFASYLTNPVVLIPKLKIKQSVKYNGTPCFVAGVTGTSIIVHNGVELFTDNRTDEYVNALCKLVEMNKKGYVDTALEEFIMKTNSEGVVKLKIDRDKNVELYNSLLEKLSSSLYQGVGPAASYLKTLLNGRDSFERISVYEQVVVLLQILRFFKCNAEQSDLHLIGGASIIGVIRVNKDITNVDFRIVYQSPCGLNVREIKV